MTLCFGFALLALPQCAGQKASVFVAPVHYVPPAPSRPRLTAPTASVAIPGASPYPGSQAAASLAEGAPATTDSEVDPSVSGGGELGQTSVTKAVAAPTAIVAPAIVAPTAIAAPTDAGRCSGVPSVGADGTPPPAPPHTPLGEDLDVPGDRPLYWLAGDPGDPRVIVYLHGMCGDVTAADFFREAVRAHGTLVALRGDKLCAGDRFKWRDEPSRMHQRIRHALSVVQARRGGDLDLTSVLLFGYSQGAERAEKLAERYPKLFSRVVLGGPPTRASPTRLAQASAVAVLGGELETTENMRAGAEALLAAGIRSRFFSIECAYHGWYGTKAEDQMSEVLDWVTSP